MERSPAVRQGDRHVLSEERAWGVSRGAGETPRTLIYARAASKRAPIAPQSTTFQIASRYSGRRFWYFR